MKKKWIGLCLLGVGILGSETNLNAFPNPVFKTDPEGNLLFPVQKRYFDDVVSGVKKGEGRVPQGFTEEGEIKKPQGSDPVILEDFEGKTACIENQETGEKVYKTVKVAYWFPSVEKMLSYKYNQRSLIDDLLPQDATQSHKRIWNSFIEQASSSEDESLDISDPTVEKYLRKAITAHSISKGTKTYLGFPGYPEREEKYGACAFIFLKENQNKKACV